MKNKIIVALTALLVLVGCGAKGNGALDIAKALNTQEVKEVMLVEDEDVTTGRISIESTSNFYEEQKVVFEETDESKLTDEEKEFVKNYSIFMSEMSTNLVEEEGVDAAFVGVIEDDLAYGVMVYTFPKDVKVDKAVVDAINTSELNEFEYVYVNKNIVITVDYGFVNDMEFFWSTVDQVVESYIK